MILQPVYDKMEQSFKDYMPHSLYLSYEELSQTLGSTPQAWEHLLDQPELKRFIDSNLSKYMEIDARKALNRLANDPNLTAQNINALTKIIENSKLMQQKHQQKQHVFVSYMPKKEPQQEQEKEVSDNVNSI